eukprot:4269944-Pyramimonas_sp.AAC.1
MYTHHLNLNDVPFQENAGCSDFSESTSVSIPMCSTSNPVQSVTWTPLSPLRASRPWRCDRACRCRRCSP